MSNKALLTMMSCLTEKKHYGRLIIVGQFVTDEKITHLIKGISEYSSLQSICLCKFTDEKSLIKIIKSLHSVAIKEMIVSFTSFDYEIKLNQLYLSEIFLLESLEYLCFFRNELPILPFIQNKKFEKLQNLQVLEFLENLDGYDEYDLT